jgi:hypothetical protein
VSDHISGPRALAEPLADITDFYAFPSPGRPERLVLIQNTYPFAQSETRFSDGLIYRFRIRPVRIESRAGASPLAIDADEFIIDCQFSAASEALDGPFVQTGVCTANSGLTAPIEVNAVTQDPGGTMQVFAGARWDPFFMDAPAALKTIATQQLAFTDPGTIFLDGKSVLSLVVEVDLEALGCHAPLIAVITETLTNGKIPVRLERVGRPEVKNMMLAPQQYAPVNRDLEIRDLCNMEDAFHLAEAYQGAYRARLDANLAAWDAIDGKVDWPFAAGRHPLTEVMLTDFLVVDCAKPYQENGSFFEIERAALDGTAYTTCGGRAPNDDVMDTIFSLLIDAGTGPRIRDGVDQASQPASQRFPYLAPPSSNPPRAPEHH